MFNKILGDPSPKKVQKGKDETLMKTYKALKLKRFESWFFILTMIWQRKKKSSRTVKWK